MNISIMSETQIWRSAALADRRAFYFLIRNFRGGTLGRKFTDVIVLFVCLAIHAEMRQPVCDIGNHMYFNCGFVLSMLCPVDAPVCECDCRRINRIYVAEFEAGKFSFMLRLDFFMPH